MNYNVNEIDLDTLANLVAEKVVKILDAKLESSSESLDSDMKFEDARFKLFHGKSREWIKYYILQQYPSVLTTNGGWITPPTGKGVRIKVVDVNTAQEWLKDHNTKIDWNAPEPITLKRRIGLAKPIRRRHSA